MKIFPFFSIFRRTGILLAICAFFLSCDANNNFILFSIEDDKALGLMTSQQIASDPQQFPILSEQDYPSQYAYIRNLVDIILQTGEVTYRDEFAWEITIIDDDVLNAFATPGGYLYVYTGLIKFLETEDDLMGVLGHEIAHSDRRHSSQQLQSQYGISLLLQILLGENPSDLAQIAGQLAGNLSGLAFSRSHETESDEFSVIYLARTDYACNGAASFFQKLLDNGQTSGVPEFLSTHPDSNERVAEINAKATELNCDTTPLDPDSYDDFKNSLP